jgi:hypothetical protein
LATAAPTTATARGAVLPRAPGRYLRHALFNLIKFFFHFVSQ